MKLVYARKWSETVNASHSKYVLSDRIPSGQILHVHNCYAYAPEIAPNDKVRIGVRNGGTDVYVRVRGTETKNTGLSTLNEFFVGESDQVFAFFPDSDSTNTIELHVIGILYSLDEWRKL